MADCSFRGAPRRYENDHALPYNQVQVHNAIFTVISRSLKSLVNNLKLVQNPGNDTLWNEANPVDISFHDEPGQRDLDRKLKTQLYQVGKFTHVFTLYFCQYIKKCRLLVAVGCHNAEIRTYEGSEPLLC